MTQPDYLRQLDILPPSALQDLHVTLIGAGGIGSPLALALVKMGIPDLTIYDPDRVESHNLPNQIYRLGDLDRHKVLALADFLREFSDSQVTPVPALFNGQPIQPGIVISAVDSMLARKLIFRRVARQTGVPLYIEARMGAEVSRIYTFNPSDEESLKWYEEYMLYEDREATPESCTAKAIIYNVFVIASLVANQVRKFLTGQPLQSEIALDLQSLVLMTS